MEYANSPFFSLQVSKSLSLSGVLNINGFFPLLLSSNYGLLFLVSLRSSIFSGTLSAFPVLVRFYTSPTCPPPPCQPHCCCRCSPTTSPPPPPPPALTCPSPSNSCWNKWSVILPTLHRGGHWAMFNFVKMQYSDVFFFYIWKEKTVWWPWP